MSRGRLRQRSIEFPGGPASLLALGSGATPVLLLHGFAGDRLTWQFVLSPLAADRQVLAVDLPGHGRSTADVGTGRVEAFAPWLERLLDALELPRVHVIGHSMGGYVAICLACGAPERVASLSLIAPAGLGTPYDGALLQRLPGLERASDAAACAARLFGGASVSASALAGRTAEALLDQAGDPRRRAALERIVAGSFSGAEPAGPLDWSALRTPVQVLWGSADTVIPPPSADRLPPGAPFHRFDNAGHLPHSECPGPVAAVLRDFLARADGAADGRPWSGIHMS